LRYAYVLMQWTEMQTRLTQAAIISVWVKSEATRTEQWVTAADKLPGVALINLLVASKTMCSHKAYARVLRDDVSCSLALYLFPHNNYINLNTALILYLLI